VSTTRQQVTDIDSLIEAFRSMSAEEIAARGFTVEGTFDQIDDPILLGPDGLPVNTWRERYPYAERMSRSEYEALKRDLQVELLKAQDWIRSTGHKLVMLFEGRDAAGKGGTIKRFLEHLDPRGAEVVALSVPSEREQGEWFFQRYVRHLPTRGEMRFFDRSWYNRAGVERVMGYCTDEEYEEFLRTVPQFEEMLMNSGTTLIKLWFSVSRREQIARFTIRRIDPVRQWKLSPTDIASLDRWDDYTAAKLTMFERTSTERAPWNIVRSNDKKRGRINAIRHVLHVLPYDGKNLDVVVPPDPLIVGTPDTLPDHGEAW
jgi:polyphosphate kinase 2